MNRKLIWMSIVALTAAGIAWGQRGHGVGAGGQGAPPSLPSQAKVPAAPKPHTGQAAKPPAPAKDWTTRMTGDSALALRLTPLLPAGATLPAAAEGFRNQGQFVAALHVSKNLNIPFADLKARMTGPDSASLGKAIQELRPELDKTAVVDDVKKAEKQAREDMRRK